MFTVTNSTQVLVNLIDKQQLTTQVRSCRKTSKSTLENSADQGCQMIYFQTKNTHLGTFWRALIWRMFVFYDH
jgi:hypothetical protein